MSSSSNRRHRRRNYTSVSNEDADDDATTSDCDDGENFHDEPLSTTQTTNGRNDDSNDVESNDVESSTDEHEQQNCNLSITILDSAQKKFPIPCRADWTVGTFKRASAKIHKVAPAQQRLIFRGKMLTNDDLTLKDHKLDTDDLIVHLFPKPRVVVTASKTNSKENDHDGSRNNTSRRNGNGHTGDDDDTGIVDESAGAHVTTIVIDQEEQDRRGRILVLGSVEIAESQNSVKMLSLLLVMICAMRLLALFSIAAGAAEEPNDPYHQQHATTDYNDYNNSNSNGIHNHTGDVPHNEIYDNDFLDDTVVNEGYMPRAWQTPDYFDLLVSATGFYVGTLGMKATQENTSVLATAYAIGTIVVGIGWNVWNVYEYLRFVKEQTEYRHHRDGNSTTNDGDDDSSNSPNDNPFFPNNNDDPNLPPGSGDDDDYPPLTRDDFVTVAFFTILMPLAVWGLCCVRAFEFRRLLREAEEEAAERILNEYVVREGIDDDNDATGHENEREREQHGDGDGIHRTNNSAGVGSTTHQSIVTEIV